MPGKKALVARLALWKDVAMVRRLCVCAVAAGLVAVASCRVAETDKREDTPNVCSGVATTRSRSYASADAKAYPTPLFAREGKRLHRRHWVASYWLPAGRSGSLGPVTQSLSGSRDDEDSVAFHGVNDRLWSLAAGPGISWPTRIGLFGLSGVAGTLGSHRGQELEFSYRVLFNLGGFDLIPSAGMRWKSQDFVDYSYSMRSSETWAGRPAYEGENTFDPFVRLAVRCKLTEGWSLLATAQYEWLDGEIRNSPVADADYDASLLVSMLYLW